MWGPGAPPPGPTQHGGVELGKGGGARGPGYPLLKICQKLQDFPVGIMGHTVLNREDDQLRFS